MRVLAIHQHWPKCRAAEDEVESQVSALRQSGLEVELLEFDVPSLRRIPWRLPFSEENQEILLRKIDSFAPHLVHAHNIFPSLSPSFYALCHERGIPVVQSIYDGRPIVGPAPDAEELAGLEIGLQGRLGAMAWKRALREQKKQKFWGNYVNQFLTLSEFEKKFLIKGGLDGTKISVKQPVVLPPLPSTETVSVSEGFALYVGQLCAEDGLVTLLEAWKTLEIPLWIVAENGVKPPPGLKPSQFVRFLGAVNKEGIARLMTRAEFFVAPTEQAHWFPQHVPRALSHGLPVIGSNIGAIPDFIRHERNGFLFAAGSAEALRACVNILMRNRKVREKMSKEALRDYQKKFVPELAEQTLIEIYKSALKEVGA